MNNETVRPRKSPWRFVAPIASAALLGSGIYVAQEADPRLSITPPADSQFGTNENGPTRSWCEPPVAGAEYGIGYMAEQVDDNPADWRLEAINKCPTHTAVNPS